MSIHVQDVQTLADFQQNPEKFIRQIKENGQPLILTVNGDEEVVVQDAATFRKMMQMIDRMEAIEGIKRGLESMKRGEGKPAEKVFAEIRQKYNIPEK